MERAVGYVDAAYLDQIAQIVGAIKKSSYELLRLTSGSSVADIGCGPASDTLQLGAIVGGGGRVVGVDHDPEMVAEAQRRAASAGLTHVTHTVGDARHLPFDDGELDAVRAERVLQHLDDPVAALAELRRVVRPGGRVVVVDTDWLSLSIDVAGEEHRVLERAVSSLYRARCRSAYAARELPRHFDQLGFVDTALDVHAQFTRSPALLAAAIELDRALADAVDHGAITPQDTDRIRSAIAGGAYGSVTVLVCAGTKA